MKRKIFFRFFSVTLASTLIVFLFGFFSVQQNAENVMRERLIEETKIVALIVNSRDDFEEFKAYEGNDKFRVTFFDTNGNVIFESDTRAELENHIDRAEVQSALNDQPQTVTRYSQTFDCEMTYYAMKVVLDDGEIVILRLAIRSSELSSYLSVSLPLFIIVLVVALVLSLIISHFISINISSKVVNVGKSLKSLNEGKYVPISAEANEPELYSVLGEINELNESTLSHIEEMEREQRKLSRVLESISQGIIAVNDKREIVFINKSAYSIFSCGAHLVGKELISLIDDTELYATLSAHIFENCAFEFKYKDRYLSLVIHELAKDDLKISSIVIITDITKERAIAKEKSEFFANASHELKTPITVMQGLTELMLNDEDLGQDAQKRIERIHKESVRMASLISDMLMLSRLENGTKAELATASVNIRTCFEEALEGQRAKLLEKNISVCVTGEGKINADPQKIYEIAENLCSNAINYNKEGGSIFVTIKDEGDVVSVSCRDTGIGIEKKHIPLLCQRFYRVDKSHSKKTGGTGLGLAIVKHICAIYGATLEIESELNQGTVVTVKFKK